MTTEVPLPLLNEPSTPGAERAWRAASHFHRRLFRLAIHDLSNPLAAARLLAELQRRGASTAEDLEDLTGLLGRAASVLGDLRAIFRDGPCEPVDVGPALELVLALLESEKTRAGVQVLIGRLAEARLLAPRHLLLQWLLAGLLGALDASRAGDVLVLGLEIEDGQVRLDLQASAPATRQPSTEELLCLRELAAELGGRWLVAPGERSSRDPAWALLLRPAR
jgi:hypothetical protein